MLNSTRDGIRAQGNLPGNLVGKFVGVVNSVIRIFGYNILFSLRQIFSTDAGCSHTKLYDSFIETIYDHSLSQMVREPTRVTGCFGPIPVQSPSCLGPIPFQSGHFSLGHFCPISGLSFRPIFAGSFRPTLFYIDFYVLNFFFLASLAYFYAVLIGVKVFLAFSIYFIQFL